MKNVSQSRFTEDTDANAPDWVRELIATAAPDPTYPMHFLNEDGDCLEIFFSGDSYFGCRIDSTVTVYLSEETKQPIGVLLKGLKHLVRRLAERLPNASLDLRGEKMPVSYLITAYLWALAPSDAVKLNLMVDVRNLAEAKRVEVPGILAANGCS